MLDAKLFRFERQSTHTTGALVINGYTVYVLERPWLDNKRNKSCIPSGKYICKFLPRSGSGKYRNVYHVVPVDNRSGILIHQGNLVIHSLGCLIIGSRIGTLSGKRAVLSSRQALRELNKITQNNDFNLEL